jgi:sirohydrochlorin ferrochelatase
VIFRRGRFGELVDRQLDLFERDEASLLAEADEADAAWTRAGRDESEELFGDYQLVVDAVAERLLDVREAHASTLEVAASDEYRKAFDRAANKRFRTFTGLLGG